MENRGSEHHSSNASDHVHLNVHSPSSTISLDDDENSRLKRTGTECTVSSHIITALIGSGVMSLAWAMAQLGWIAGPAIMILFSSVTYYTSTLMVECYYRTDGPFIETKNLTYMDAVRANLGGFKAKLCGAIQYLTVLAIAISFIISSSTSMMAIQRSKCIQSKVERSLCKVSSIPYIYMISFGVVEIVLSQIPNLNQLWWLSIVAAAMSFTYCTIGIGLGISKVVENERVMGNLTGISVGTDNEAGNVWQSFQAVGAIAFSYYYSLILTEIQDTIKAKPSEHMWKMRKATCQSVVVTTILYLLCGCVGYAAFGDLSPRNLIVDFAFHDSYWLLNVANSAIVIHFVGAYQVYCQPFFGFVEKLIMVETFPEVEFLKKVLKIPIPGSSTPLKLNLFRVVWRTIFVITTTFMSVLVPFFLDLAQINIAAFGFWPLTVYFPVEMYIVHKRIPKWGKRWISLRILSMVCLITIGAAAVGTFVGVVRGFKLYRPFTTSG